MQRVQSLKCTSKSMDPLNEGLVTDALRLPKLASHIIGIVSFVVLVVVVSMILFTNRESHEDSLQFTKKVVKSVSDLFLYEEDEGLQPKILCWIELKSAKAIAKLNAVNDTWGKRCDKLVYIGQSDMEDQELKKLATDLVPSNPSVWDTTLTYLSHLHKTYLNEYDWFLKTDENTFVVVGNLRYLLTAYNPDEPITIGSRRGGVERYLAGCLGYVISRGALATIVDPADQEVCRPKDKKATDASESLQECMASMHINIAESMDEFGKERIFCVPANQQIHDVMGATHDISGVTSVETVSKTTISFHGITSEHQMYAYDFFIYRLKLFQYFQPFEGSVPAPKPSNVTQ